MCNSKNTTHLINRIKKLKNTVTLLHVTAHPDDEDIGLMSYYSKKYNIDVYVWCATRGEGGQNRVNNYKNIELGGYRTFESINVSNINGTYSIFGPFIDFGYSKNAVETFKKWGRNNVVKEIVRAIRITRANIIVSRRTGTQADIHGHHQAIGEAVLEAFDSAKNPSAFPELLDHDILPWSPEKLYVSTDNMSANTCAAEWGNLTGNYNSKLDKDNYVCINTGEYSFTEGKTYQEIAWEAYNMHQTQGISVLPEKGDFFYYFQRIKPLGSISQKEKELFDSINITLSGLADDINIPKLTHILNQVTICIDSALTHFDIHYPIKSGKLLIPALNILENYLKKTKSEFKTYKEKSVYNLLCDKICDFYNVICDCFGIRLEGLCTRQKVTPNESVWVSGHLWNYSGLSIFNPEFEIDCPDKWVVEEMGVIKSENDNRHSSTIYELFIDSASELTKIKWSNKIDNNRYMYDIPADYNIKNQFDSEMAFIKCKFSIGGTDICIKSKILNRQSFPGGYRELPLMVVPPISLHPNKYKYHVSKQSNKKYLNLKVNIRCNDDELPAEGDLILSVPTGWNVTPKTYYVKLNPGGDTKTYDFKVTFPDSLFEGTYSLKYIIRCRNRNYDKVLSPVRLAAPGFSDSNNPDTCSKEELILSPAVTNVFYNDAVFNDNRKYAYIKGIAETIPDILYQTGLKTQILDDHDLQYSDLNLFDTIIVGPNAYLVRSTLKENAKRILEFINNGGTLIVQYQGYDYQRSESAPYTFSYSSPHDRVTDENSLVTILKPDDIMFHYPNKIKPTDFDNWVHDRGLYFWGKWDKRYEYFLSCADPDETQKQGGLLRCKYGKGIYIYTGYSFFRQLETGVPGSFSLFYNILSFSEESENLKIKEQIV